MRKQLVSNTLKLTNNKDTLREFYARLEELYTLAYSASKKTDNQSSDIENFKDGHTKLSDFIAKNSQGESTTNPMTGDNIKSYASEELKETLISVGKPDSEKNYDRKITAENLAILLAPIENNPEDLFKDMDLSQLKLEDFHKRLSERLLNQQIESKFASITTSADLTKLEKYLTKALTDIEKKEQAEILSPIVTYCDEILQKDIEKGIFNTATPTEYEIIERVSELTFTVIGSGQNVRVSRVFERNNTSDKLKHNGAGAGIVDSILINPYKNRLIGHSTTVDTSGDIEKDQLYRHPFKVFSINQFFYDKDTSDYPNSVDEITTNQESKIIEIQKWGKDDTYNKMNDYFEIPVGEKIDAKHIEEMYEKIDYSFDAFGDLLSQGDSPIIKIIKLMGFLEYQESQANQNNFTEDAIAMMRKKIIVKSKGFYGFEEILQKMEKEEDGTTKTLLLVLIADAMQSAASKDILNSTLPANSYEYYKDDDKGFKNSIKDRLGEFVKSCQKLFEKNNKLAVALMISDKPEYINSIVPKLLKYLQQKSRTSHIGALILKAIDENLISKGTHERVLNGDGLGNQNQVKLMRAIVSGQEKDAVIGEKDAQLKYMAIQISIMSNKLEDDLINEKIELSDLESYIRTEVDKLQGDPAYQDVILSNVAIEKLNEWLAKQQPQTPEVKSFQETISIYSNYVNSKLVETQSEAKLSIKRKDMDQ